jgi:diadenosine tetraphosphate (Ap4A) HIT family hydrolase
MSVCPFCKIEKSRLLFESELAYVILDNFPVNNGHMLVIPKKHDMDYFNLSIQEKEDLWNLVDKAIIYLTKTHKPDGVNIGINVGEAAGQTIMHCHIHLIPRYKGDMEDPRGGVRGVIPTKQKY